MKTLVSASLSVTVIVAFLACVLGIWLILSKNRIATTYSSNPRFPKICLGLGIFLLVIGILYLVNFFWIKPIIDEKNQSAQLEEFMKRPDPANKTHLGIDTYADVEIKKDHHVHPTVVQTNDEPHIIINGEHIVRTNPAKEFIPSAAASGAPVTYIVLTNISGNVAINANSPDSINLQTQSSGRVRDAAHKRDIEAEKRMTPHRIVPPRLPRNTLEMMPAPAPEQPQMVEPQQQSVENTPVPTMSLREVPHIDATTERVVKVDHSNPLKTLTTPESRTYIYGIRYFPSDTTKLQPSDIDRNLRLMLNEFADTEEGALRDDDDFDYPPNPDKQKHFRELFNRFLDKAHEKHAHNAKYSRDWKEWMAPGTWRVWFSFPTMSQNLIPGL